MIYIHQATCLLQHWDDVIVSQSNVFKAHKGFRNVWLNLETKINGEERPWGSFNMNKYILPEF